MLSGGSIPEQKLDRYLRRVSADNYTPLDRTDKLILRLCKEGYLVRNRDVDGGEEVVEYLVGPRGKVEVGVAGVSGLAREVFGFGRQKLTASAGAGASGEQNGNNGNNGNGNDDNDNGNGGDLTFEEFEGRLNRSLGIEKEGVCWNGYTDDELNQEGERDGGERDGDEGEDSGVPRRQRQQQQRGDLGRNRRSRRTTGQDDDGSD